MKLKISCDLAPLLPSLLCIGLLWTGCRIELAEPDPPTPPANTYPTTPPTELPPATQTGAGTLGCKINGRVWTFWVPPFALTPEQDAFVTESDGSGLTNIRARIWSADTFVDQYRVYHSLYFSFFTPGFEPKLLSKAGDGVDNFDFSLRIGNQSKKYVPDTLSASEINNMFIDKIDIENNIISGRFNLKIYREVQYNPKILDKMDSLVITDGRFDFRYTEQ